MMGASLYRGHVKFTTVQWTTGPYRITQSIKRSMRATRDHCITVLPAHYFELQEPHPDAIVSHHHDGTWVPVWMYLGIRMVRAVELCVLSVSWLWS